MDIKRYFFEHELSQITHKLFVNDYIHEKFMDNLWMATGLAFLRVADHIVFWFVPFLLAFP